MAKAPTEIRSLARSHTDRAIAVLAGIMDQPDCPPASRVAAAEALLNRGWGKPAQAIIGGDDDDPAVKVVHEVRQLIVDPGHSSSEGVPPTT